MVTCVTQQVKANGQRKILVIGTQTTCNENLFGPCAQEVLYPSRSEQEILSCIIRRVLAGRYWRRDHEFIDRLARRYRKLSNIEAIVLGCTEFSVLFEKIKSRHRIPQIDPLKLLASRLIDKGTPT